MRDTPPKNQGFHLVMGGLRDAWLLEVNVVYRLK